MLAPNFHGSTGFGHAFCRAISGNWEIGGVDTVSGVRAALATRPWLDADRVVGLGASYGGYTSNWLNGNAPTGMFKALVTHCAPFDLRSSYYATEELFFMETEFGGPPPEMRLRREPADESYAETAIDTVSRRGARTAAGTFLVDTTGSRRASRWASGPRPTSSSTAPRISDWSRARVSRRSRRCRYGSRSRFTYGLGVIDL